MFGVEKMRRSHGKFLAFFGEYLECVFSIRYFSRHPTHSAHCGKHYHSKTNQSPQNIHVCVCVNRWKLPPSAHIISFCLSANWLSISPLKSNIYHWFEFLNLTRRRMQRAKVHTPIRNSRGNDVCCCCCGCCWKIHGKQTTNGKSPQKCCVISNSIWSRMCAHI